MAAFRAFAGLSTTPSLESPPVVETEIFGEANSGQRLRFAEWVQNKMGMTFSDSQLQFARRLRGPMFLASCAVGAGKTKLIVALALGLLHSDNEAVLHISEPNRALVREVYDLLNMAYDEPDLIV